MKKNNLLLLTTFAALLLSSCVQSGSSERTINIQGDSVSTLLTKRYMKVSDWEAELCLSDLYDVAKEAKLRDGYIGPCTVSYIKENYPVAMDSVFDGGSYKITATKLSDLHLVKTTLKQKLFDGVEEADFVEILRDDSTHSAYISLEELFSKRLFPDVYDRECFGVAHLDTFNRVKVTAKSYKNYYGSNEAIFDFDAQTITFKDFSSFYYPCTYGYAESVSAIDFGANNYTHFNKEDRYRKYSKGHPTTIELREYGMKMFKYKGSDGQERLYVPFEVGVSAIVNVGNSYVFDGDKTFYTSYTMKEDEAAYASMMADIKKNNAINDFVMHEKYYSLQMMLHYHFGVKSRLLRQPNPKDAGLPDLVTYVNDKNWETMKKYKKALLSQENDVSSRALAQLLTMDLDDGGHTRYNDNSGNLFAVNVKPTDGPERTHTAMVTQGAKEARNLAGYAPTTYDINYGASGYTEMECEGKKIAYVTFDSFTPGSCLAADIDETNYSKNTISLVYWANKQIKEHNIKNVVIDLTCNNGGSVDSCLFVQAWVNGGRAQYATMSRTDDSYLQCTDYADINLDGKYDLYDVIDSDIKFFCITSNGSYSCGNLLPTLLAYGSTSKGRTKFIGDQTGGGCCSPEEFPTCYGDVFRMSRALTFAGYDSYQANPKDNENGVPLKNYWLNFQIEKRKYVEDKSSEYVKRYDPKLFAKFFDRETINNEIVKLA